MPCLLAVFLPSAAKSYSLEEQKVIRWEDGVTHTKFLRYHFQPFSLNLVLPSVVKPSGAIAKRGTRHLTCHPTERSPSLMPLTFRRPLRGAEK